MRIPVTVAAICVVLCSPIVHSNGPADGQSPDIRILVTFSDPGMGKIAPAGPTGPGYRRASGSYLTSVRVNRAARRIAKNFYLVQEDEWPISPLAVHCVVYRLAAGANARQLLEALRQQPDVESAQLQNNFDVLAATGERQFDSYADLQHVLATLEIPQAHLWSIGSGSRVTIIDTGADLRHPEFQHQIAAYKDFVTVSNNAFSADAHGTAIAGIIAANADTDDGIIGIAPAAQLSVFRACWYDPDGGRARCNSFTLAQALSLAIESGADVINLSLGGPSDALLGRLVSKALDEGITVIAAAPLNGLAGFPTEVTGVIVVGAQNSSDGALSPDSRTLNAPGDDILVAAPNGGYDFASGSSLAAAHVSGIVALLVSEQPSLTPAQVQSILSASRHSDTESVNACRALAQLLNRTGCTSP